MKKRVKKKRKNQKNRQGGRENQLPKDKRWCPVLWFVRGSLSYEQGFGSKGGQSPVEHRENLYIRMLWKVSLRLGWALWRVCKGFVLGWVRSEQIP